ncbi:MAG: heme lyase CcmF/NrfE family subunit [Chloroflexi bacterium]|nr:heme lyase CcmF/NrfE family subunit [Chloroflexota bacterium]
MLALMGYALTLVAFVLSLYATGAALWGGWKRNAAFEWSARNAMLAIFPLLTAANLILMYLLAYNHFEVEYVHSVSEMEMPLYLRVTALWGGQAGSLLFWSWLMAAFAFAVGLRDWHRDREFLPWVVFFTSLTLAFFLFLNTVLEPPFRRFWLLPSGKIEAYLFPPAGAKAFYPRNGSGLNPLLRHPGMVAHPPFLYLGFVSFVIPYAFAMAALVTRRVDARWIRLTRPWTLVAWLFLFLGLILGSRWAYDVLGWGGYWGWDPVEISAFMPWLTGTAFLHSVIVQEQRGILKRWNIVLIILTYALVLFGTFLTRSGVLSSVHSFAQSAIGPAFFIFIGAMTVLSVELLRRRWDDLEGKGGIPSFFSREALFLYTNYIFISMTVVNFWGVVYPLVSELVTGEKASVGPPYYERAMGPLSAVMLLLMGLATLAPWGRVHWRRLARLMVIPSLVGLAAAGWAWWAHYRAPGALLGFFLLGFVAGAIFYDIFRGAWARHRVHKEPLWRSLWRLFTRNRRRYGGYVVHLSIIVMGVGIIGIEFFQAETQRTLAQGESLTLREYTIVYDGLAIFNTHDGRQVARAEVSVYKDGQKVAVLHPRQDYYIKDQQPMTIPGVYSTWGEEFYVLLVSWKPITVEGATFKVYHNPLVKWLWASPWIAILGILIAAWPERRRKPATARARARRPASAPAPAAG